MLPGDVPVVVGAPEETWVCVELGWGLRATLDLDEGPGKVRVGLHLPYLRLEPVGARPYDSEAAVRVSGQGSALRWEVVPLPAGGHDDDCGCGPDESCKSGFSTVTASEAVPYLLAILALLPRRGRGHRWAVTDPGARLWRGDVDASGRALIQSIGDPHGSNQLGLMPVESVTLPDLQALRDPPINACVAQLDAAVVAAVDSYLRFGPDGPGAVPFEDRRALGDWLAGVPADEAARHRVAGWARGLAGPLWEATSSPWANDPSAAAAWSRHALQVSAWRESATTLEEEVWTAAAAIGPPALVRDRLKLAEVLADASDRLSWDGPPWVAPGAMPRPGRWAFRAFLDPGAGMLWSADTSTETAFGYPVDHRDLPIRWDVVGRVDAILERYARSIPVTGPHEPFTPAEWAEFREQYRRVLHDLRNALGSAYTIQDEQFGS